MSRTAVEAAIGDVCRTLTLDGYVARYEVQAETLRFDVEAGSGACEDCLSPKPVLHRMLDQALQRAGIGLQVQISYPGEGARPRNRGTA
ncbi:hypothetical protein [Conexibacter sp. CPCC 206217]|uniref:hypothetical protein n=1 Tax=Conexibacter sp. CPCC 206217 TaxID=3064574 RepID=UPI00272A2BB6|nr:hypothetical protein [Conexibacter sp. CPCC 206217]